MLDQDAWRHVRRGFLSSSGSSFRRATATAVARLFIATALSATQRRDIKAGLPWPAATSSALQSSGISGYKKTLKIVCGDFTTHLVASCYETAENQADYHVLIAISYFKCDIKKNRNQSAKDNNFTAILYHKETKQ